MIAWARVPVALDPARLAPRRRVEELQHGRPRSGVADRARVRADRGQVEHVLRLLLRAHDPLQRRVARLVDRVRDGDHGRERRLDRVVAVLGLPLAADRAVADRELGDLRDERAAEAIRDGRPEHGAVGVRGLLSEQDERRLLALERERERVRGGDEVGADSAVVGDEHDPVGAHRKPLAQAVERLAGPSETSTTSPSPWASRSRRPSSIALASKLLSTPSPERSSRLEAGSIRRLRPASGTLLTQTAMRIDERLFKQTVGGNEQRHERRPAAG